MHMERPTFEFHIAREARDRYAFADRLFSVTGNVVIADLGASRELAHRMNSVSRTLNFGAEQRNGKVRMWKIRTVALLTVTLLACSTVCRAEDASLPRAPPTRTSGRTSPWYYLRAPPSTPARPCTASRGSGAAARRMNRSAS